MSTKIFQTCFTTKWFSQFWIRTDERFSTVSLWTEIPKITIYFQNLHHHLFFLFGIFYGFHFVVEVEVARSLKKILWSWILSFLILEGGYYLLRKTNTMYFFISFNGYYSVYLLFVFLVKWPILRVWLLVKWPILNKENDWKDKGHFIYVFIFECFSCYLSPTTRWPICGLFLFLLSQHYLFEI